MFNSSGPFSIFSKNSLFKLRIQPSETIPGSEISFNDTETTSFNDQRVIGKFVIDNSADIGLSLTDD